jgi:hypothetical protein
VQHGVGQHVVGNVDASTSKKQSLPKGDWEGWYSYGEGGTVHATDSQCMCSVYLSHWSSGSEWGSTDEQGGGTHP